MKILRNIILIITSMVLFNSCNTPTPREHLVYMGKKTMYIYKKEIVNSPHGKYKYGITDDSKIGWILYSFDDFKVDDSLYITNVNPKPMNYTQTKECVSTQHA